MCSFVYRLHALQPVMQVNPSNLTLLNTDQMLKMASCMCYEPCPEDIREEEKVERS